MESVSPKANKSKKDPKKSKWQPLIERIEYDIEVNLSHISWLEGELVSRKAKNELRKEFIEKLKKF
jgi:hypothetical protein